MTPKTCCGAKSIPCFLVAGVVLLSGMGVVAQTADSAQFSGQIRLLLPPRIYAVPAVEMNVYFNNICLVSNPSNYVFDVTCAKGKQQFERWTFVPKETDVGTYPLVVEVRDQTNAIIARAESVLEIVSGKTGAGASITVLTIGDSLTHAAVYPQHLLTLCKAKDNPNITLVGHAPNEKRPEVRIEGYGGWTANRFATFYKAGKRTVGDWRAWNSNGSPFLYPDASGKPTLDFARYCQEFNGGRSPDFVTILLGCNDVSGATDETIDATIDRMFTHYDQLVAMIRQVSGDTRIGVLLVTPPAGTQDAFGTNYKSSLTQWQFKRNQQRVVERLMRKYEDREAEGISLVPVNVSLDCLHNYPTRTAPGNSRTSVKVTRLNNGVHPSTEGYRQIGDTLFCWIKAQLAARR